MRIESLDHVALWLADRDAASRFLEEALDVHVIDQTDKFTLVGSDARCGKLTLFAADGPRLPAALGRIGFRVSNLEDAARRLPAELELDWDAQRQAVRFAGPEGLLLALVESATPVEYDLDHVALRVRDREGAHGALATLGFERAGDRLVAGGAFVDLVEDDPGETDRPLLNHLGLRVESADDHLVEARERGLEIADVVDAANTIAVFLWGDRKSVV